MQRDTARPLKSMLFKNMARKDDHNVFNGGKTSHKTILHTLFTGSSH